MNKRVDNSSSSLKKVHRGFSIVESSLALTAFVPIVVFAIGIADYLSMVRTVSGLLDQYVQNTQSQEKEEDMPTFHIRDWDVYVLVRPGAADGYKIKEYINKKLDFFQGKNESSSGKVGPGKAILTKLFGDPEHYRIEIGAAVIPIDWNGGTTSGIGLEPDEDSVDTVYTGPAGKDYIGKLGGKNGKTYFNGKEYIIPSIIDDFNAVTMPEDNYGRHMLAIPTGLHQTKSNQFYDGKWINKGHVPYYAGNASETEVPVQNFFRFAVITGMRITVSLEGTLAGQVISLLGKPPVITRGFFLPLRSDF